MLASRVTTVLLATAIAALLVALAAGALRPEPVRATDTTALLVTDRPGLLVCVASLDPAVPRGELHRRVRDGLTRVAGHPDFAAAGLARRSVEVHEGCDSAPTVERPEFRPGDRLGAPHAVDRPSRYRLLVFAAPAARTAALFGGRPAAVTAHEVLCANGTCPVVTSAAYLAPAALADDALLDRTLTEGVGLRPTEPRNP
ncbi:MAG TPA: hypothetical protein VGD67_28230 [Pseudonocardiaceae bacterium]